MTSPFSTIRDPSIQVKENKPAVQCRGTDNRQDCGKRRCFRLQIFVCRETDFGHIESEDAIV